MLGAQKLCNGRWGEASEAFVQIMGRTAAPQTEAKSAETMNRAYHDARHDYALNRVHALGSYE